MNSSDHKSLSLSIEISARGKVNLFKEGESLNVSARTPFSLPLFPAFPVLPTVSSVPDNLKVSETPDLRRYDMWRKSTTNGSKDGSCDENVRILRFSGTVW